jgi:hypothetical protein
MTRIRGPFQQLQPKFEMASLKDQLIFTAATECDSFEVNKMRLNLPKGGYVCVKCSRPLAEHHSSAVTDEDVAGYFAHASGRDGATCILDASPETGMEGKVYLGTYFASINPFVSDHCVGAVVNCSDLHLSERSDFHSWALKVESLEKCGVIAVIRLNWSDTESQRLWDLHEWDQLVDSIRFIHQNRKIRRNVLVHCAQGKSRSGAVAVAYIMAIDSSMTFERALAFVQSKRAIVDPNRSFAAQLKVFESSQALQIVRQQILLGEI